MIPPQNETTHLNTMLGWLHRLLAWQIKVTQQTYGELADDAYRGLHITPEEAELLGRPTPPLTPELLQERAALAEERNAIEETIAQETQNDAPLLLLAHAFGLSPFEHDVLVLALAPEIDLSYERIYAYIQDNVTKTRPTVDLALRLLCLDADERLRARSSFAARAPLLRHRLISLIEETQRQLQPPLLARALKIDDRIVEEVLSHRTAADIGAPVDAQIALCTTFSRPQRRLDDLLLPIQLAVQLRRSVVDTPDRLALGLQGSYGSGRKAIAEALCTEAGVPLLTVDLDRMLARGSDPQETLERIVREALLHGAALLYRGCEPLLRDETQPAGQVALLNALDAHCGISFLVLDRPWEAHGVLRRSRYLCVELPDLSYSEREHVWQQRLGPQQPDSAALQALASTFRLSGGQIRDAATMARSLASWRGTEHHTALPLVDLYAACRAQSSGRLGSLAHKVTATYSWDDIVLPPEQLEQVREICARVRHRRTVLERWGFDRRLAMGKGINVLFAGQSGTGKTMAAEIVAAELGLELYKVDLSSLVSKYIGETEKNLDRIFSAAREANAVLFFDEADAIFGKRSEVRDAHDRYANIEVGYLLQKMEEYDGVVILATNLSKNLDSAFIRRLHVAIDFPFPEDADRLRIWRKAFPPEAPLAEDVDLVFIARQFKLSGGNIRNIALLAAYLAAEDDSAIGMRHVVRAINREYQKLGKLIVEADFGPYLALTRNASTAKGSV